MKKLTYEQALKNFKEGNELWYYTGEQDEDENLLMSVKSLAQEDSVDDIHFDEDYFIEVEDEKDVIINALMERLNACFSAMDSATDDMREFNLTDMNAYYDLLGELAPNEELLKAIKEKTNINSPKQDFIVQELAIMGDRNESLKQALKDCRQAMLDTGRFNKNSLQIISIDLELNK